MSDDNNDKDKETPESHTDYKPERSGGDNIHRLSGMYETWFLDYASYVILERAVPHLGDGLKPVQRRILYTMKRMDDGKYNKVANIVGETMKFHPHGDASIYDALVQLGQKGLLVDTQGNWGNILTDDSAAAPRYIEARLSRFALDVLFNAKTTEWKLSYDGRNEEPVTLPVKFPLLLAQGAEGIAVGLSSKILPHNFTEICDAAIHYLHGEDFELYPDFPTGGSIDVSRYNDGERGGSVKVRATITKVDNKTLRISEIPFGKTTQTLIDSILKANDKGKIKIKNVVDMTAAGVEILVNLAPGTSPDKAIDALYAFTDCEVSISPNCCVIEGGKPRFMKVSDVLRFSVDRTRALLQKELEIHRGELQEQLFFASLEKIFIEKRIYKEKQFEQAPDLDTTVAFIDSKLEPYKKDFIRPVTREDILRLLEIKMQRILKFNKDKADELMARLQAEIDKVNRDLGNMTEVAVGWYNMIKARYGADHPRLTEIRSFDTIEAAKVAEANEKLYINRADGFIGTALKKDEFVENCSDIDDVIIFYRDGTYKVTHIADKLFVGETERSKKEKRKAEIIHLAVYRKGDKRTTYNAVYRDGKGGAYYYKRFNVAAVTHDREYDLTQGKPGSRVVYFSANPAGEAEVIRVVLKPNPKIKKTSFEKDFGDLQIKGRQSRGNLLTRHDIYRVNLKSRGVSTLGGSRLWFDRAISRLNIDGRGDYLGEFKGGDRILVVLPDGTFYTTDFDLNNHYEPDLLRICRWDADAVWTAVLRDASQNDYLYLKRFRMELSRKPQNFLSGDGAEESAVGKSQLIILTNDAFCRFRITPGGADAFREPFEVEATEFVGVKSFKARGKRLTMWNVESVEQIPSTLTPAESDEQEAGDEAEGADGDNADANNGGDNSADNGGNGSGGGNNGTGGGINNAGGGNNNAEGSDNEDPPSLFS